MRTKPVVLSVLISTMAAGLAVVFWIGGGEARQPSLVYCAADLGHIEEHQVQPVAVPRQSKGAETAEIQASNSDKPEFPDEALMTSTDKTKPPVVMKKEVERISPEHAPVEGKREGVKTEETKSVQIEPEEHIYGVSNLDHGGYEAFGVTVGGAVMNADGATVGGARVEAELLFRRTYNLSDGSTRSLTSSSGRFRVGETDSFGVFTGTIIYQIPVGAAVTLILDARKGNQFIPVSEYRREVFRAQTLGDIALKVVTSATVRGRIEDQNGKGVEGTEVKLDSRPASSRTPPAGTKLDRLPDTARSGGILKATTDADGNFQVHHVLPGLYGITASHPAYRFPKYSTTEVAVEGAKDVQLSKPLIMELLGTVRVTIMAENAEDVKVLRAVFKSVPKSEQGSAKNRPGHTLQKEALRSEDGVYTFMGIADGEYTVVLQPRGSKYLPGDTLTVEIKNGQQADLGVVKFSNNPDYRPSGSLVPRPPGKKQTRGLSSGETPGVQRAGTTP